MFKVSNVRSGSRTKVTSLPEPVIPELGEQPPAFACQTLELKGSLQIKDVEKAHGRLTAALAQGVPLAVNISGITAFDTAGAQLFIAFQKEAAKQDILVTFTGECAAVANALTALGLRQAVNLAART